MINEPLMQELKAITDYLDWLDKDWRAKIRAGASGTMTPVETHDHSDEMNYIGRVTPRGDSANVRTHPSTRDHSAIISTLNRTPTAMNFAEVIDRRSDEFDVFNYETGKTFVWYKLRNGGYVREDVVEFRPANGTQSAPIPPINAAIWPAPITGYTITNTHHNHRQHIGIDLAASIGARVLSAPNEGYVMKAFHCLPCGDDPKTQARLGTSDPATGYGLGNYVVARYYDHPAENRGHFLYVLYAHLSKISVQEKQSLPPYTVIGEVGTSGNSTGPHLHIECRYSDNPLADFYAIRANEIDPSTIFKVN